VVSKLKAMVMTVKVIFKDVPVSFGDSINRADAGEYRLFAGIRSDPFFFDVEGMKNNMQFTGADTFLDKMYLVSSWKYLTALWVASSDFQRWQSIFPN
jgi:hypothetical protein